MDRTRWIQRAYLGLAVTYVVGYAVDPGGLGPVVFQLATITMLAALAIGPVLHRIPNRQPFRLLIGAGVLAAAAAALRPSWAWPATAPPLALVPDLIALGAFGLLGAGLVVMLRLRGDVGNSSAVHDGVIVTGSAALVAWSFVITTALEETHIPLAVRVLYGVFPVVDTLLLFLVLRIEFTAQRRPVAYWALLGLFGCLLTGDTAWALRSSGQLALPAALGDAPRLVGFLALGFAVLHPTAPELVTAQTGAPRRFGLVRQVSIVIALVLPVVVVNARPPTDPASRAVVFVLTAALSAAVIHRLVTAVRRQAATETVLAFRAHHDTLTGLINRTTFAARLDETLAATDAGAVSVLFVDLDRFKYVNDTFGHETGDEALVAAARRITSCVRGEDLVARLGGDKFLIAAVTAGDASEAEDVAQRVIAAFSEPVTISAGPVFLTPSIGIASARPPCRAGSEDLIRDADVAMYEAKARGRNTWVRFDDTLRTSVRRCFETGTDLRYALERGELHVVYQPIVDMTGDSIEGFEALVRWTSPERGPVSPGEFIPVAEETGLIVPIGEWVLDTALAQLARWRRAGHDVSVAVNVSARQFHAGDLPGRTAELLTRHGVPAGALWLEVTETAAAIGPQNTAAQLRALRALGVHIAADDFGTGYSSLTYLKQFPVDAVKIDRSFVAGIDTAPDDDAIVAAVMGMAASLRLECIAEGVETPVQRDRLRALGCTKAQGYLFAPPQPAGAAGARLRAVPAA